MSALNPKKVPGLVARCLLPAALLLAAHGTPPLADDLHDTSAFQDCRTIEEDARRLRCYDTVADGGVHREAPLREVAQEEAAGEGDDAEPADDPVSVTIVRIQTGQSRVHYFHTADGTVWQQTGRGSWSQQVPFQAEIRPGLLGSYFLVTEGGKSTRVKRVE